VPDAGRLREHSKIHIRACTQVLLLGKAELGFFSLSEIVIGCWYLPPRRSPLLKAGFFKQVMELKL
jgi:hypothetical protein